ncbi:MAG: hypothetical protein CMJ27_11730 [Phycisphaerae bacterium]|nr:hypothetical protein [Phycisphaerae bacterium]OUX00386.1 MAG: hypothetical protein CBD91_06805 [Phycisphaeraceae bacterium TMED231]
MTLQYRTASHRRIRGSEGSQRVGVCRSGRSPGSTTTFDEGSSIHTESVDDLGSMTRLVRADGFHPVACPALPAGTSIRRSSRPPAVMLDSTRIIRRARRQANSGCVGRVAKSI